VRKESNRINPLEKESNQNVLNQSIKKQFGRTIQ
jgi:citrate lyase gamma subunit